LLTPKHTHDDAHGLVPTRLTVDFSYIVAYIPFEAQDEHGLSFGVFNMLMI
jgi:hypothetical protein